MVWVHVALATLTWLAVLWAVADEPGGCAPRGRSRSGRRASEPRGPSAPAGS